MGPGCGRQGGVGPDADNDQDHVGQARHDRAIGGDRLDLQPPWLIRRGPGDRLDGGAGQDLNPMPCQLGMDQRTQFRVDGGQHLTELLHLSDRQPADGEGVGHFQADVPGADNDRAGWCGLLQGPHDGEGVAHRVQQVHTVAGAKSTRPGKAADQGADRDGAGADDEFVVAQQFLRAVGGCHQELACRDVDTAGGGVQSQPHPGRFQVSDGAVSQVAPVGDLPGEVVGDAADREVRVGIRDDHADIRTRVKFAGPQGGADPGVAAADHDQVHGRLLSGCLVSGAGPDRAAGPRTTMRRRALRGQVPIRRGRGGGR
jgi:hypothetical protein